VQAEVALKLADCHPERSEGSAVRTPRVEADHVAA
jgi:hypothetical protein